MGQHMLNSVHTIELLYVTGVFLQESLHAVKYEEKRIVLNDGCEDNSQAIGCTECDSFLEAHGRKDCTKTR